MLTTKVGIAAISLNNKWEEISLHNYEIEEVALPRKALEIPGMMIPFVEPVPVLAL